MPVTFLLSCVSSILRRCVGEVFTRGRTNDSVDSDGHRKLSEAKGTDENSVIQKYSSDGICVEPECACLSDAVSVFDTSAGKESTVREGYTPHENTKKEETKRSDSGSFLVCKEKNKKSQLARSSKKNLGWVSESIIGSSQAGTAEDDADSRENKSRSPGMTKKVQSLVQKVGSKIRTLRRLKIARYSGRSQSSAPVLSDTSEGVEVLETIDCTIIDPLPSLRDTPFHGEELLAFQLLRDRGSLFNDLKRAGVL